MFRSLEANRGYAGYSKTPRPQRLNQVQKSKLDKKLEEMRQVEAKEFQRIQSHSNLKRQIEAYQVQKKHKEI